MGVGSSRSCLAEGCFGCSRTALDHQQRTYLEEFNLTHRVVRAREIGSTLGKSEYGKVDEVDTFYS